MVHLRLTNPILPSTLFLHSLVRFIGPLFSASIVGSLASAIPFAAATTTAVLTGEPCSLNSRMNCLTWLSKSFPRISGLPHFFSGILGIDTAVAPKEESSYLYAFTQPRTVGSLRSVNSLVLLKCFNEAVTPFSEAHFAILALSLAENMV